MRKLLLYFFVVIFASSCRGEKSGTEGNVSGPVREAVFAGKFYPSDPKVLTSTLQAFFDQAKKPFEDSIIAVIVPHAGYIFSGQIAADGFSQVKDNHYDLVVILGTNHTSAGFKGISVYPKGAFATPIGNAEIDEQAASALLKEDASYNADLSVHENEHSIEVQVPFIKYLFPGSKILPVIVSGTAPGFYTRFGRALANVLKNKRVLIVASSDLSHYPGFDDALQADSRTLRTIASLDLEGIGLEMHSQLNKKVPDLSTCACGEAPILAAISAAKELGAKHGSIISYSNSGYNPLGDITRVVGYGSVAISRTGSSGSTGEENLPGAESKEELSSYTLTDSDKETLLAHARSTLAQYLWTQTVPVPRGGNIPLMKIKRGAFVTLRKDGELRGCIGYMGEDIPLYTNIGSMALSAAFKDSRFNPLSPSELPKIRIEISVLTPYTRVNNSDDIVTGRDGVLLKKGNYQGVFLPQVATENGWDKQMFLDQLCHKAGLNPGDWMDAELFTFQADVFSEKE